MATLETLVVDAVNSNGHARTVARILHHLYGDVFVCTARKYNRWWAYKEEEHRWRQVEDDVQLRRLLSLEVAGLFEQRAALYESQAALDLSEDVLAAIAKLRQTAELIHHRLLSVVFKGHVMTEARQIFYSETFLSRLDRKRSLLCFENGVYDLDAGVLRHGVPEDMLSKTTGLAYVANDLTHACHQVIDKRRASRDAEDDVWCTHKAKVVVDRAAGTVEVLFHDPESTSRPPEFLVRTYAPETPGPLRLVSEGPYVRRP